MAEPGPSTLVVLQRRDVTHWMNNRTWWPQPGDPGDRGASPYLGEERLGQYIADMRGYVAMVEDAFSGGARAAE